MIRRSVKFVTYLAAYATLFTTLGVPAAMVLGTRWAWGASAPPAPAKPHRRRARSSIASCAPR